MLAVRPTGGYTTMGRETFMARVIWENGWPVVNPGVGIMTSELVIDLDEWIPEEGASIPGVSHKYVFSKMDELGPEFMQLRNPNPEAVKLIPGEGLRLLCQKAKLNEEKNTTFVGIRQDCHAFEAGVSLETDGLFEGAKAGIVLLQSNEFHLRLEYSGLRGYAVLCQNGVDEVITSDFLAEGKVSLVMQVFGTKANLLMGVGSEVKPLAMGIDISSLSTEVAGGFVGCTIGMYATDEEERDNPVSAKFTALSYRRITPEDIEAIRIENEKEK